MKKALLYILSSIADEPEKIKIEEEEIDNILTFKIHAAHTDMGKIIGKNGKIIRAIRNIVKIPAIKQNKKINILLEESSN
ncbi:MAG: KH domain-containing protein [Candidatus Levybacteria bacterium]|nr:KH domain-containing protein [Candidatus Levybacteria bacterium]